VLRVVGSSYLAETRSLCNLLDHNRTPYKLEEQDLFTQGGGKPLQLIDEHGTTILADPPTLFRYALKRTLTQHTEYAFGPVKRNSDRLARLLCEKKLSPNNTV
jgi:hypothetical protein